MTSCSGFCVLRGSQVLGQSRGGAGQGLCTERNTSGMGPQGGLLHPQIGSVIQRARGGGRSLDVALRKRMSACMNHDFRAVRVHTGREAGELSSRLGARALTVGSDIFFADGAYDPTSRSGQELIAHELVHVAQQGQGASGGALPGMTVSSADDPLEHEAASLAARAVSHAHQPAITIRLKTANPRMVLRALSDECKTAAPIAQNLVSCHAATLWWIYRTAHPATPRDPNGWDHFIAALGDSTPNELIADLITTYGRQRESSIWFRVRVGAVVVFATGTTAVAVQTGHSCVCGGSNELYGHSQGGRFSSCKHGNAGQHCHHWATKITWYEDDHLYQVDPGNVATWAAAHF